MATVIYKLDQRPGEWTLSTDEDRTVDNLNLEGRKPER